MRFFRCTLLLLACACESPGRADAQPRDVPSKPKPDVPPERPPTPQRPPIAKQPLERSTTKLGFPGRGGPTMPFAIEDLAQHYALAAEVELPTWGQDGRGEVAALRDDDLDTQWTCTVGAEEPCAFGLHFPRGAEITAVGITAGGGPSLEAWERSARIKRLRLHTTSGVVDTLLPDEPSSMFIWLPTSVDTANVVVEVLEAWGPKDASLPIAEVELYGTAGEQRAPWMIDPSRTFIALPSEIRSEPWNKRRSTYTLAPTFVHAVDSNGNARRWLQGSALYGARGDRLLLLERMTTTTCERSRASFFLVDQQTRMIAPLGTLAGVDAEVFRREDGLGFAAGHLQVGAADLSGVELDDDAYRRRRTVFRPDRRSADPVREWHLDPDPLVRGGHTLQAPPKGCVEANEALIEPLNAALGKDVRGAPEQWVVCDLDDGAFAFVTDAGPCGRGWAFWILDRNRQRVDGNAGNAQGSVARLRKQEDGTLYLEIHTTRGSELFHLRSTGSTSVAQSATLAVALPEACRRDCK